MMITKTCYECGEEYEVEESELSPTKDSGEVWLCTFCRMNDKEEIDP